VGFGAGFSPHKDPDKTNLPLKIDFNRDVRPILAKHCWPCHGTDKAVLAETGNMRLDSFKGATEDRGGYQALVPGHPEKSKLVERVSSKDRDMRMPPAARGLDPLGPNEIALLERWIKDGGEYRAHWAYIAPKAPSLPAVKDEAWAKSPIDRFVLAELERAKLKPEPAADKRTLIRRVALTLTGLPPTVEEVAKFLGDASPTAYESMVDRYLASPRYGEHLARYWLDAVRYGDTHGLHLDNERSIYPYRDWVVRAFNQDLPFDQFTLWQFAGDMLPDPTVDQKIATGYIRMNPTTNEGGAIEAEFLAKNTFDRVETTSTVYLGATFTCARCHDHKYDPFSQRDYYGLFAIFNNTVDAPLDGNNKVHPPVMKAPSPEQSATLKHLEAALRGEEGKVDVAAAKAWILAFKANLPDIGKWEKSPAYPAANFDVAFATEYPPEKGGEVAWTKIDIQPGARIDNFIAKENAAGYVRTTIRAERDMDFGFRLGSDDAIRVWLNGKLVHDNKVSRGLIIDQDPVSFKLAKGDNTILIKVVNGIGPDGLSVSYGDPVALRIGALARAMAENKATDDQIRQTYLEVGPESPKAVAYRKDLAEYRTLDAAIPFTLIAEELKKPREAYRLKRGEYDRPIERAYRALPALFGPWPKELPKNRLGLARWLIDPKNPLVARVFVNRIWQQHFGTGIVKTSEDFGSRGEWPTHPELLDYLATRFVKNGWSIKKLHKEILVSNAFRQASTVPKQKLKIDPENRLISRGPRFRLDAEVLRDQALYVGGILKENPGGKGFKPYQPDGIWEAIAFVESDTSRYVQDMGDSIYRRSLYLFWKRTSPHPTMLAFDAPMRESCTVRRSRTNTPLQALVTLNETAYLESARNFGERALAAGKTDAARIRWAFESALARPPKPAEASLMLSALKRYRERFEADTKQAEGMIKAGASPLPKDIPATEVAAWTMIASTLINTDEFLTQH